MPEPRWGDAEPVPSRSVAGAPPFGRGPDLVGDRSQEDDDEDDDLDDDRPKHPYTWLHLIVLALVAFVLGFVVVLLLDKARPDSAAAGLVPPVVVSSTHAAGPPAGVA